MSGYNSSVSFHDCKKYCLNMSPCLGFSYRLTGQGVVHPSLEASISRYPQLSTSLLCQNPNRLALPAGTWPLGPETGARRWRN
uniref:Apple domain-containing protein n=1 Tax=Arundo donax TaxID=35708 RepID=A0A0A8YUZ1_ARUDO